VSFSLVVLRSPDMERTARFYRLLGVLFERERHGTGPEHLAGPVGSAVLEIYPQGDEADTVGVRLGFRVASVEAVVQAVRQAGGTVVAPPRHGPWGFRAVLGDPDGRRVEVTEEADADPGAASDRPRD
jgi:predicted enzyme related to lactoylglutathione lyase